jgi:hypothetical protein
MQIRLPFLMGTNLSQHRIHQLVVSRVLRPHSLLRRKNHIEKTLDFGRP